MQTGWLRAAVLLAAVACGGDDDGDAGDVGDGDAAPALVDVPISILRPLDVLFVIDDSATMVQEQEALAAAIPAFVGALIAGHEPVDLHVGVVSSNLGTAPANSGGASCAGDGDQGHLLVGEACAALDDGARYVVHEVGPDGETINYTGALEEQIQCMTQLGIDGCGFEQHLESMKRALENEVENAGFLRDDANLAVIVLADEDDCSASDRALFIAQAEGDTRASPLGELSSFRCFEFGVACAEDGDGERELGPRTDCVPDDASEYVEPIATYAEFLSGVKGGRHRVAFAAIVGDPAPVEVAIEDTQDRLWVVPECKVCPGGGSECTTSESLVDAAPAIRLNALADRFSGRSQVEDICAYDDGAGVLDYAAALSHIGTRLRVDGGTRCLASAPADRDPDTPGLQPLCEVTEGDETIASCADLSAPCWYLSAAPECADSETALVVDRGDSAPGAGELAIRCAAAP